ncbi:hypothetical protein [Streptomyces sp. NPDC058240]|uniref:hypothetical protein n=1 Tax=Streptomyces sp. NPDC058240 TaxID=3346396 RepID=UPI0036E5C0C7
MTVTASAPVLGDRLAEHLGGDRYRRRSGTGRGQWVDRNDDRGAGAADEIGAPVILSALRWAM